MVVEGEDNCLICGDNSKEELRCRLCFSYLHFRCAFGSAVNNPKSQTAFKNGEYTCPVCIIAKDNRLVLKAVSTNQKYLAATSNIIDFKLPQGFLSDHNVSVEESDSTTDETPDPEQVINDAHTTDGVQELHQNLIKDNFKYFHGIDGSPIRSQPTGEEVHAEIHERDAKVAKTLLRILNTLRNLPTYRSTLLISDSNGHFVKQGEVDPESRSVASRAVSGLCVVAAAEALRQYTYTYGQVKKLIWCIGPNDCIHKSDHCEADWSYHLQSLVENSARVFPNAAVTFILPFKGLPRVPSEFVNEFLHQLKQLRPKVRPLKINWLTAPSMKNKVNEDGVHLNHQGKDVYLKFLRKRFTKSHPGRSEPRGDSQGTRHHGRNSESLQRHNSDSFRPPNSDSFRLPKNASSTRSRNSESYDPPIMERRESFRVGHTEFPPLQQQHPAAQNPELQRPPPWPTDQGGLILRQLGEAITHMMQLRRCGPTPATPLVGRY